MRRVWIMEQTFFKGKKILVTGHTGFKGSWLCELLLLLDAEVTGYSLEPPTNPSLYQICDLEHRIHSVHGDIRDLEKLRNVMRQTRPELVLHMAAQPIVREGYRRPAYTYEVNVMGTVNILECVRESDSVRSFLNVTTDKVYRNREWDWGYRENEELNGYDPYSNSKSCSELVTSAYRNSFFPEGDGHPAISTARAGNVIGGGDFAVNRIIPDCYRAAVSHEAIELRNPDSIRPYQHVLEPLTVYLMILQRQYEDHTLAGSYNVGPDEGDCWTTRQMTECFGRCWQEETGEALAWHMAQNAGPHEANYLKLDCSKLKNTFGWRPEWNVESAVQRTAQWYAAYQRGENMQTYTAVQINDFLGQAGGQGEKTVFEAGR